MVGIILGGALNKTMKGVGTTVPLPLQMHWTKMPVLSAVILAVDHLRLSPLQLGLSALVDI
jgi:hypothetical protein